MNGHEPGEDRRRPTDIIALDLYVVEGIDWASLSDNQRDPVAVALRSSRWRGRAPDRFGFTVANTLDRAIYGYFSQEFPDVLKQYDDRKAAAETVQPNFVDLVFLLAADTGFLLLQDRRFHNEGGLSMPVSRTRFGAVLSSVTRRLRLGASVLTPKEYVQVSREEFLAVIRREEIWELQVDHLAGRAIPNDVVLFNPDVDAEGLYREVWSGYERDNVSEIRMRRAPGGNLRYSKVARAASHAGDPKRVVYGAGAPGQRERRELRRVRGTHMPGVTVHRPINEQDAARILRMVADLLAGSEELERRGGPRPQQLVLPIEDEADG